MFKSTNCVTLCQNSVSAKIWGSQKWGFRTEILFFVFYVGEIETEKEKREKAQRNYKDSFFQGGHPRMWKIKKWILAKWHLFLKKVFFDMGKKSGFH